MGWEAVCWIVALIWVSHLAPAVWVSSHLAVHSTPSGKTLASRSPRQDLWGVLHDRRHAWDALQITLHPCSIHVGVIIQSPVSSDNLILSQVLLLHPDHKWDWSNLYPKARPLLSEKLPDLQIRKETWQLQVVILSSLPSKPASAHVLTLFLSLCPRALSLPPIACFSHIQHLIKRRQLPTFRGRATALSSLQIFPNIWIIYTRQTKCLKNRLLFPLSFRGQQTFPVNVRIVNILSFVDHRVSVTTTQLCHCIRKAASDHK